MPTNQKVLKSNRVYPDMVLRNRYSHRAIIIASSMKIMLFMISLFQKQKWKGVCWWVLWMANTSKIFHPIIARGIFEVDPTVFLTTILLLKCCPRFFFIFFIFDLLTDITDDTSKITIRIPAVVVLSHMSIFMLMRLLCCPDLTSPSTNCDIHPSWIAGTQWIAFLTFIIILRTDRSLFSALDSRLHFPPFLWVPFLWPSGGQVVSVVRRWPDTRVERRRQNKVEDSTMLFKADKLYRQDRSAEKISEGKEKGLVSRTCISYT